MTCRGAQRGSPGGNGWQKRGYKKKRKKGWEGEGGETVAYSRAGR